MKCPHAPSHMPIECAYIDTAGMDKTKECNQCEHYPVAKIHKTYPIKQLLDMLPNTIIIEHKQFWRYDEIFDLRIEKDSLKNWYVSYINDMSMEPLFSEKNKDLHWCLAEIVSQLISNKYIS